MSRAERMSAVAKGIEPDAPPNGRAMATDPLGSEEILERFYRPSDGDRRPARPASTQKKPKPTHYKIVCISLYNEDIELLESLVAALKQRGHTKANKSQVIRAALDQIDLDKVQRGG